MDINTQLGKYKLTERLGKGGMAEVFKAFQSGVERYVAIKVMHAHLADSADFQARFQREAKAVGRLQHPHIVRVIDFETAGEHPYMVMEFVQGGSLRDYLEEVGGALSEEEAVALTKQLADALRYAHGRGMVHRDIKPANVLFSSQQRRHAVLSDFGIARLLDEAKLTMSSTMLGTPAYMAPEIVKGEPADKRADLYSLGAMLYEMVTGRTPHTGDTPYAVMLKQANDPLPLPREINPEISESLESFLLKSLEKDPKRRFQSAEEMIIALQSLDKTAATSFVAETSPRRKPPPSKNKRMMPLVGAILGVVAIAAVTLFLLTRGGGEEEIATVADETPTAEVVPTDTAVPTDTSILPTDEPTAVPVIAPTDTSIPPTAEPTLAPTATIVPVFNLDEAPSAFVCNIAVRDDTLAFALDRVRLPAEGMQYAAWVQMDGESYLLDVLSVENGRVTFAGGVPTPLDGSVIGQIEGLFITEEPLDSGLDAPTGQVILAENEGDALESLRGLTNDLVNAETQILLAINHRNLLQESLAADDLAGAKQHAEHVLNILAVARFGDMDDNGRVENPGDEVGVYRYVEQANEKLDALSQPVLTSELAATIAQLDEAMRLGERVFATDSAAEASPISPDLDTALQTALLHITTANQRGQSIFAHALVADEIRGGTISQIAGGSELLVIAPDLLPAPAGFANVVWIVRDDENINVGVIENQELQVTIGADGGLVQSAEIRLTPLDADTATPTGDILFAGTLNGANQAALTTWLFGENPSLPNLLTQAGLAEQHTQLMQESLANDDLDGARQHAEHVINIMEGADGNNFGDLDNDGRVENPGDGVGVQRYLVDTSNRILDEQQYETALLARTFDNQQVQMETAINQALKLLVTDSVEEAQPFADEQIRAVTALLDGADLDENGVVDAFSAEAGLLNMNPAIWQLATITLE